MRFGFASAVLATLAVPILAFTLPTSSRINHVVHEKRDTVQRKWIQSNTLDPDHVLPARIGLKQSNLDLGAGHLSEM